MAESGELEQTSVRLRDQSLQAVLERDGYLKVPFLGHNALAELQALWDRVEPPEIDGIYSNLYHMSIALNREIDERIVSSFNEASSRIFDERTLLTGGAFLAKGTGPDSGMSLHQDWCIVDERTGTSLAIWVPLIDVDEDNGAIQVLPGSHQVRQTIRSVDVPSLYIDFDSAFSPHLVPVTARAGEAIIYYHRLFHGSKQNWSNRTRVAAVAGAIDRDAQMVHYRRPDPRTCDFELLHVDHDFFMTKVPAVEAGEALPRSRVAERIHEPEFSITPNEVMNAITRVLGPVSTLDPLCSHSTTI